MPQKHNPVGSAVALSAAIRVPALVSVMLTAMVQENERGLGNWPAEWETLPEICLLTAGALQQITRALSGLQVDTEHMARNLEATRGQIYAEAVTVALAHRVGKSEARKLVEESVRRANQNHVHLREALADDPEVRKLLSGDQMGDLFDASQSLGSAEELVERVLRSRPK